MIATAYAFDRGNENEDQIGYLGDNAKAIFGESCAAEQDLGCHWCHRSSACKIPRYHGANQINAAFLHGQDHTGYGTIDACLPSRFMAKL
jgi:hypothetical protein